MRCSCSPRTASSRCSERRQRSSSGSQARELAERYRRLCRDRSSSSTTASAGGLPILARRLRDHRGRHGHRPPRAGLRRGRLPRGGRLPQRAVRPDRSPAPSTTRSSPTAPTTSGAPTTELLRGPLRQGPSRHERADRGPARAGPAAEGGGLRALLPALLALRHPADLLRQDLLVHRHLEAARRAAGGERDGHLAPASCEARALRRLARQQRRLGPLARALLGHATAGVALPGGPHAPDRLVRRARAALRDGRSRTTTARSWTRSSSPALTPRMAPARSAARR